MQHSSMDVWLPEEHYKVAPGSSSRAAPAGSPPTWPRPSSAAGEPGGPLTSWNREAVRAASSLQPGDSHQKHSATPPARGTPGSQLAPADTLSSAGRPERYINPGAELLAGGYTTAMSSSFEERGLFGLEEGGGEEPLVLGAGGGPGPAFGTTPQRPEDRSPSQRSPHPWVPPGMDAASYAAGEKAAALQAFHKLLPQHQAMGQLLAALEALAARLDREADQWHALQVAHTKTTAQVETALQRLDTLDFMRIPQLTEKVEEARSGCCAGGGGGGGAGAGGGGSTMVAPAELTDALQSLQQVLANLTQLQQLQLQQAAAAAAASGAGATAAGGGPWSGSLQCLLRTAGGYAQQALSQADVAAMFLSRKILLTEVVDESSRAWELAQRSTAAVLFLAAVEVLWRGQQALARRQRPAGATHDPLRPVELALRITRGAVWTAAAVLSVAGLKEACSTAADAGVQALRSAALPAWLRLPMLGAGPARLKRTPSQGKQALPP